MSQDGFGIRTLSIDQESGDPVEVLTFAPALAQAPEFATAVGERVARLARVRHAMYARARRLDRRSEDSVHLISDHVPGWRLDHVLDVIEHEGWKLDISAVIVLLRQLIPAVALFSRHQRDATIGTIGPERLILTPQGRLVVAEYVLAPGLEKMRFSRERLWREFRVTVPHAASVARIPPSADVVGIGVVAFSLLLGRRLKNDEYLVSLGDLADSVAETQSGAETRLSAGLHNWVAHALQFELSSAYQTVQEAQVGFEEMLAKERSSVATAVELERFIATFHSVAGSPRGAGREQVTAAPPSEGASRATAAAAPRAASRESGRFQAAVPPQDSTPLAPVTASRPASASRIPVAAGVSGPEAPAHEPGKHEERDAPITLVGPADAVQVPPVAAWRRLALPGLVGVVVIQALVIGWLLTTGERPALSSEGELSIQSRPAAARVSIDGEERGVTPFQTTISPGSHVVEVRVGRSEPRVIPVVVRDGVQTGLYVELQSVATVGGLEIRSEPGKARVTVGGQFRGETPLVLKDLPPGEVDVVVQAGSREVRQSVRIEPGITTQLVVPMGR